MCKNMKHVNKSIYSTVYVIYTKWKIETQFVCSFLGIFISSLHIQYLTVHKCFTEQSVQVKWHAVDGEIVTTAREKM